MMDAVQKPIPKPRKFLPAASFDVIDSNNGVSENVPSKIDPVPEKSVSDESLNSANQNEIPIGWAPFATADKTESDPQFKELTVNIAASHVDEVADEQNNEVVVVPKTNPIQYVNSHVLPGTPPPVQVFPKAPQLPRHFTYPTGPPPPIPPRTCQEKPLPFPVDGYEDLPSPLPSGCTTPYSAAFPRRPSSEFDSDRADSVSIHTLDSAVINNLSKSSPKSTALVASGEYICLSGWVTLKTKSEKRFWAVIRDREFIFYFDEFAEREYMRISLSRLLIVGKSTENASDIIMILRSSEGNNDFANQNAESIRFAPEDKFTFWVSLLAKSNCPNYSAIHEAMDKLDAAGVCYIRKGIGSVWSESYVIMKNHELYYFEHHREGFEMLDLRKASRVENVVTRSNYCNFVQHSVCGPILLIFVGFSINFQSSKDKCTKMWYGLLKSQLYRRTRRLSVSPLTTENVPVVVDKCIKFISAYGILAPGIYRKNGQSSDSRKMYQALIEDPHNFCIKKDTDETINCAADVLRTFFRKMESPLIVTEIQPELYSICEEYKTLIGLLPADRESKGFKKLIKTKAERYRRTLELLPEIHYNTLVKLMNHLFVVASFESENKASIDNLSRIFGPTIFTVDKTDETPSYQFSKTGLQISVVHDLLEHYVDIFRDVSHEKTIEDTRLFLTQPNPKPITQGFLLPIHFYTKDNQCFNIESTMTAEQVIEYQLTKRLQGKHKQFYSIYEVLKSGALERRLRDNEKLHDIVLDRWVKWESTDGFLLLKKHDLVDPSNIRPFAEDVKISEPGSRSFKTVQLRIQDGKKIQQFSRGENLKKPQKEWPIDEVIWFYGNADKDPEKYPYSCTFFQLSSKYGVKHAGTVVAFTDYIQRDQWLNAIDVCQRDYSRIVLVPDL